MEYSIGELAELVEMTSHGLRFYEKEGLISPKRKGKNRVYSEEDRLWVEFLMHMKDTGMSLQDMKQFGKKEDRSQEELLAILIAHREKIENQLTIYEKNLNLLDKKIIFYKNEIGQYRHLFDGYIEKPKNSTTIIAK